MRRVLYGSAAAAVVYACVRVVQGDQSSELGAGIAILVAAVCTGSGAIVDAIDRSRPKPVSRDNGGGS